MKKAWFISFIALLLLLTACSEDNEETRDEATDVSTEERNSDLEELEKENEELKRRKLEKENTSLKKELEDENESKNDDETKVNSTDTENNNKEYQKNKSDLLFDINSQEVQEQLLGTKNGNEIGTFTQNVIIEGMSQTEVEEKYGPYDFVLQAGGSAPAFYGNLAVVYSSLVPYGQNHEVADSSINPDENFVKRVYYYAGITQYELIEALGEPDKTASSQGPGYVYKGEGADGKYYTTIAGTSLTPNGELISIIQRRVFDENPMDSNVKITEENISVTESPNPNAEIKDAKDYEYLLTEYLQRLATHYNSDNYDDIFYYLKKGSPAYDKIAENKTSGEYSGHRTHSVELVSMRDLGDGTVELNANRVYSHDNSNGQQNINVTYIINAETHEVLDFE